MFQEVKNNVISALAKKLIDYEIYGETVKHSFLRPSVIVSLDNGNIKKEQGGRYSVMTGFNIFVYSSENDKQFGLVGDIIDALEDTSIGGRFNNFTFEWDDSCLKIKADCFLRYVHVEDEQEKMQTLREDIIGKY